MNVFKNLAKYIHLYFHRYFDGSVLYPFAVARLTLQRWIQNTRPPIPNTFEEYFESMTLVQWQGKYTRRGQVELMVRNVVAPDNSRIILYTDVEFTESLGRIQRIGVDATFKVCSKKPKMRQFLSIMALVDGVVGVFHHNDIFPF